MKDEFTIAEYIYAMLAISYVISIGDENEADTYIETALGPIEKDVDGIDVDAIGDMLKFMHRESKIYEKEMGYNLGPYSYADGSITYMFENKLTQDELVEISEKMREYIKDMVFEALGKH